MLSGVCLVLLITKLFGLPVEWLVVFAPLLAGIIYDFLFLCSYLFAYWTFQRMK